MKYVIIRDDDTNALMSWECLDQLYRPFLDRGMPVCLSVIPNVSVEAAYAPGRPEQFLAHRPTEGRRFVSMGENRELIGYLLANRFLKIVQHGCSHDSVGERREFDHNDRQEIVRRLDEGARSLENAGLGRPGTFVAPYDRLSRVALMEVSKRFRLLSSGWYELGQIPPSWLPRFIWKRARHARHWRVGQFIMLSHPGCLLSYHRSCSLMLQAIDAAINSANLTVLVTHWWEYFRDGKPDLEFIQVLHSTADYLACRRDLRVISFDEVKKSLF